MMAEYELTPEDIAFNEEAEKVFRQSENGPPMPESLQRKMDDQALTNAALRDKNSKARKAYDKVMSIPYDEFYGVARQDEDSDSGEDAA